MTDTVWDHEMAELLEELRILPARMTAEAHAIVQEYAEQAETAVRQAYPKRTGNLRKGVKLRDRSKAGVVQFTMKNTARHATLYERGTQARHTTLGVDRGSMPAGHVFIPIAIRKRRAMYEALKAMLEREGLIVSGDAST